jgi:hypothetical protein
LFQSSQNASQREVTTLAAGVTLLGTVALVIQVTARRSSSEVWRSTPTKNDKKSFMEQQGEEAPGEPQVGDTGRSSEVIYCPRMRHYLNLDRALLPAMLKKHCPKPLSCPNPKWG